MKIILITFLAGILSFSIALGHPFAKKHIPFQNNISYRYYDNISDKFTSRSVKSALTLTISSQTNVAVFGQSTGSVILAGSGGIAPYQYSKDGINFQTSATFSSLAAGNYTFTIRDASSATATVNATITQLAALALNVISQSNVAITGQSTGSVTLAAAGGTAPYQYSKDGTTFQSSATFSSLAARNYVFTVKDASLNTATVNVTITQSNVLAVYVSSQTNVSAIGQSTGSVILSGTGGTAPYQYSKDGTTFQSSATFSSLAAGNYTFIVRDASLVTSTVNVTITQPVALALNISSKTDVTINGQSTGVITLAGNGGTPPYQYSKDGTTFQSSATFSSLAAGDYTFTIQDAALATATTSATITQPPVLVLSMGSQTNVDIYGKSTGEISVTASGGTAPYQFSKDGTTFQSSAIFSSLAAGVYTLTVKDAASATATVTTTITQPVFEAGNIKAMNNFSPNGDGVNDKWEIEDIDAIPAHTLTVFDRGGRVLLKVKNYSNDWDGTVNGTSLAEGTYYYALTFDLPEIGIKKGFITLVK